MTHPSVRKPAPRHSRFLFASFPRTCIPSLPQGQKTKIKNLKSVIPAKVGIQDAGLGKPCYPISFRTDRSRFPPAREGLDSRLRGNDGIHPHGNLHPVIPTSLHPVITTRTENQNQKPEIRHSHESGNLEFKSNRNLSEITETEQTRFPPTRE
ncbi:putative phage associated protein [Neisseria meningitidis]|nr:putative phage associated protein [Neisseria meningitidis]